MIEKCSLLEKNCIPCQGGVPPLDMTAMDKLMKQLSSHWQINAAGHLSIHYDFKNFMDAMDFANQIASLAEQEAHHPDLLISWGRCVVEIWTHKINGLTESDFILAAKIEAINK